MNQRGPAEPTSEACNSGFEYDLPGGSRAKACWYPQMGGHVGKCVVVFHPSSNGCFEAYVWHNGDFAFDDEDGAPVHIHHCDPEQFIEFGEMVKKAMAST